MHGYILTKTETIKRCNSINKRSIFAQNRCSMAMNSFFSARKKYSINGASRYADNFIWILT